MAGMNLFAAISMALLHRERTGEGSEVATSLHAGGLWSNAMLAQGALLDAYVAPRPPRTKPRSALANQYRTSDGRWIQLTIVREDKLWPELCKALERTDLLDDPRFQTTDSRRAHATELAAILDPVFAAHPWPEWRKRLRHHEITFGLLGVLRDVPHDQQAVANGAVVRQQRARDAAHPLRTDPPLLRARTGDARPRARRTASTPTSCCPSWAIARPRSTRCARRARWADDVSARFGRFPRADTKPWRDPSRGFPQFPQAFCQSPTARRGGPIPATENTCVPLEGPENGFPPVSAGFRRCATSSAGPYFLRIRGFRPLRPFRRSFDGHGRPDGNASAAAAPIAPHL